MRDNAIRKRYDARRKITEVKLELTRDPLFGQSGDKFRKGTGAVEQGLVFDPRFRLQQRGFAEITASMR